MVAITTLARGGFFGAYMRGLAEFLRRLFSREFSRQFPKGIPVKERRKRYESSVAHIQYRENTAPGFKHLRD